MLGQIVVKSVKKINSGVEKSVVRAKTTVHETTAKKSGIGVGIGALQVTRKKPGDNGKSRIIIMGQDITLVPLCRLLSLISTQGLIKRSS